MNTEKGKVTEIFSEGQPKDEQWKMKILILFPCCKQNVQVFFLATRRLFSVASHSSSGIVFISSGSEREYLVFNKCLWIIAMYRPSCIVLLKLDGQRNANIFWGE